MMSTEETAELGTCDWVGTEVGHRYEPRRRGNFQMGAEVSRADVPEKKLELWSWYMLGSFVRLTTAGRRARVLLTAGRLV
ncbi:hypothetical protein M3J09_009536 [Ascochyta lentis]